MSKILIRFCQSPYSSALSQDGLDFALAATNYGHEVIVLFEGEGVLQLVESSDTNASMPKKLSVMPMFDIEECYACDESLKVFNVSPAEKLAQSLALQQVTTNDKLALYASVSHTVTF